jgi:hypothetical protein
LRLVAEPRGRASDPSFAVTDTKPLPKLTFFRQLEVLRDEVERVRTQVSDLCVALEPPSDRGSLDLREQLQRSISFLEQAADHLMPAADHEDRAGQK